MPAIQGREDDYVFGTIRSGDYVASSTHHIVCKRCGSSLTLCDEVDVIVVHDEWHRKFKDSVRATEKIIDSLEVLLEVIKALIKRTDPKAMTTNLFRPLNIRDLLR